MPSVREYHRTFRESIWKKGMQLPNRRPEIVYVSGLNCFLSDLFNEVII